MRPTVLKSNPHAHLNKPFSSTLLVSEVRSNGKMYWNSSRRPLPPASAEGNIIYVRNQIVYDEDYLSGRAKPMTAATVITLIVGFLFTAGSLYGEIRYEPDPALIRIVSLEDPLPLKELIRTALIASGTPRSEIEERTAAIEGIIASAPPSTGHVLNDGELLLEWMHAEHLSRYVVDQTRLDVLVDQGTYNCVSSAVFYLLLARAGGLPVHGVLTSDPCVLPHFSERNGGCGCGNHNSLRI